MATKRSSPKPTITIRDTHVSVGQFTPSSEHCQAVKALADAAARNAEAINALSNTLKPPPIYDATGIKVGV